MFEIYLGKLDVEEERLTDRVEAQLHVTKVEACEDLEVKLKVYAGKFEMAVCQKLCLMGGEGGQAEGEALVLGPAIVWSTIYK